MSDRDTLDAVADPWRHLSWVRIGTRLLLIEGGNFNTPKKSNSDHCAYYTLGGRSSTWITSFILHVTPFKSSLTRNPWPRWMSSPESQPKLDSRSRSRTIYAISYKTERLTLAMPERRGCGPTLFPYLCFSKLSTLSIMSVYIYHTSNQQKRYVCLPFFTLFAFQSKNFFKKTTVPRSLFNQVPFEFWAPENELEWGDVASVSIEMSFFINLLPVLPKHYISLFSLK